MECTDLRYIYIASREPIDAVEALQSENWKQAMTDEYVALVRNNAWKLVPLLESSKAIGCKQVFLKGFVNSGLKQRTENQATNNAFSNEELKGVHMTQPYGFEDPNHPKLVCKLHKSLYRAWFDKLYQAIANFGVHLIPSQTNPCLSN